MPCTLIFERNPKLLLRWFAAQFVNRTPGFQLDEASFAAVPDSLLVLDELPALLSSALLDRAQIALGARLAFDDYMVRLVPNYSPEA